MNRPAPAHLRRIKRQPRVYRARALNQPRPTVETQPQQEKMSAVAKDTKPEASAPPPPAVQPPTRPVLPEWHMMTPAERTIAWADLRMWVTWLNDRYELSLEQRLPRCWADHPALIEELWALKAWRHEIYTSTQPVGQAARYWHTELRTLISAAGTLWASGCRANHRITEHHSADDETLQERWKYADPLAGVPMPMRNATDALDPKDVRSSEAMATSIERGNALYLHHSIRDYATHDESWWVIDTAGHWVRVKDKPELVVELERGRTAMRAADEADQRRRAQIAAALTPSTTTSTAGADHA
jgi:hypothetical protein